MYPEGITPETTFTELITSDAKEAYANAVALLCERYRRVKAGEALSDDDERRYSLAKRFTRTVERDGTLKMRYQT